MKRLMMAAVMSTVALFLTACGENAPKKPEVNTAQEQAQPAAAATTEEATTEKAATEEQQQESPVGEIISKEESLSEWWRLRARLLLPASIQAPSTASGSRPRPWPPPAKRSLRCKGPSSVRTLALSGRYPRIK